jgi:hypothetical protein
MPAPRELHSEVLSCCGYKKCVKVVTFDDGSVVLTDDDVAGGSVGTIKLRPEAAKRLAQLLTQR